jgi:hypothetical protein
MKKLPLLLLVAFALTSFFSFSQTAPGIEWQNTIQGGNSDYLYSTKLTADSGYILGGHSYSGISGDKTEFCLGHGDYWLVKTNADGLIQWQNTIMGGGSDVLLSVIQTDDGGYILGGYSNSYYSGDKTENCLGRDDFWLVKTDSLGNILWQNTIGGGDYDRTFSVQQTLDGGYIVGGASSSNISGDKTENNLDTLCTSFCSMDYWIVKTDDSGNIQWQNTIGGSGDDWLFSLGQTADGGYILGGLSESAISGDKTENSLGYTDYWIVKTDDVGNIQWQNTIGGSGEDILKTISQSNDGGYILGGYSNSNISVDKTENCIGYMDYWIVKTDNLGNIQWQNTIGGMSEEYFEDIYQTSDGGYILGGFSNSNISGDKTENCKGGYDYWIVKIDSVGNIKWQKTIGGNDWDRFHSIQQTSDGGYIIGGNSRSNISGDKTENCMGYDDYWIVKLYPDTITSTFNIHNSSFNITISPNPFTHNLTINLNPSITSIAPITISMYDVFGKEVLSQSITTQSTKLETTNLSKGVYFLKAGEQTKKVAKM